ncbi:MAG: hypothetical protein ACREFL_03510 [Stellaceae bacterium]
MARRTIADGLSGRERALLTLAFIGLAAPLMPIPGDHPARIAVHFRHAGMAAPQRFAAPGDASLCAILAAALSFQDRATGGFTRVDCGPS